MDQSPQQSHFRDWLRQVKLTGCAFAAQFGSSQTKLIFYEILDGELDASSITAFFDLAAQRKSVGVLLGPKIRSDDDTVMLLRALDDHPRWTIAGSQALARDSAEVGVQMTLQTAAGSSTDAMGFAPSAFMPTTRRAPYLALAAWTGGYENPNRKGSTPGWVTMGDAPPPELGSYDVTWERTRTASQRLAEPDDVGKRKLRRLAFRLDRRAVTNGFPELLSPAQA